MVHSILFHWTPPRNQYQISLGKDVAEQTVKKSETFHTFRRKDETTRRGLLDSHKSNRHKAFPQFWKSVNHILKRYNCNCNGRHSCELRNCWTTPPSLIALLQKHFSLEVEGISFED